MSRLSTRVLLGALGILALATVTARGGDDSLSVYEIGSSEGGASKGTLTVGADGSVVRKLTYPDASIHTYTGAGQLSGARLAVRFDAAEPKNVWGEWTLHGENENGAYHGVVTFGLKHGRWVGFYKASYDEDGSALGEIEVLGKFQGLALQGERRIPRGDAAAIQTSSFVLAPDGLTLTTASGVTKETLTRAKVPSSTVAGPSATYTFEDASRITGTLSTGFADTGSKVVAAVTTSSRTAAVADPFPSSLRAVRDTKILKSTDKDAAVLKTVRQGEQVPVCGRENGFWVVGPFADASGQTRGRGTRGYLPEADLDNRLHYAFVPAPIFLPGKPPSVSSVVQRDLGTCYFDAALMAIAHVSSRAIESMIRDNGDDTVSVRFYDRASRDGFDEEWVRIKKSIIVDERGRTHYTVGTGGELWPALVEKAFAAWRGRGWYRNIEGGVTGDVFEVILGIPARTRGWNVPLPVELGQRRGGGRRGGFRGGDSPALTQADLKALNDYRDSDAAKNEANALKNKPAARRDLAYVDDELDALKKLGLTEATAKTLHDYYKDRLDGPLGSGQYGPQAKEVFELVKSTIKAKRPVAMSTRSWGNESDGVANREDLQVVPGLASSHEYMVMGAYEDDAHLCWVKVVNPWHRFARRYDKEGDKLVARAAGMRDGADGDRGAFSVELSDVMRYFSSVAYAVER